MKNEKDFEGTGKLYAPQQDYNNVAKTHPIDKSIGQGLLYSHPDAMAKGSHLNEESNTKQKGSAVVEVPKEVAMEVRSALVMVKDAVMDKLGSLSLPAEAVEAGRKSMENIINTYGSAKDAVQRTTHRIAESITPAKQGTQVAEDVDKNVLEKAEGHVPETHHSKAYHDLDVSTGTTNQIKSRL